MHLFSTLIWKPTHWFGRYFKPLAAAVKSPEKLIFTFIILNLCITIPLATTLNIWFDEAYTLNTTGRDLGYAIHQAIHFEEQAPLYFVILTLWRHLSSSIFFARLFSILCISLTIYISTLISKRLFAEIHPGWVAIALSINPFMIWAAVEIRLFAFSILFSALALLFFLDGYWHESRRLTARWLHGLVAVIALYTHYFLLFSIMAYGIALLCFKRQVFLSYCRNMLLVGASLIPVFLYVIGSQQFSSWLDNPITTSSHIFSIADSLRTSFAAALLYLMPAKIGDFSPASWRLLRFLFLGLMLLLVFVYRRSINSNALMIWTIALAICTMFLVLFNAFEFLGLNNAVQHFRHTISLLVPALFSVIAVFSLIQEERKRRIALGIWLGFTLAVNFTSIYLNFSPLAKNGDYIRVASYLQTNESYNQPILVFNPEVEMSLSHYYKGMNQLIALPRAEKFQTYDLSALILKDEQEVLQAIPEGNHSMLWLVTDTGSIKDNPDYSQSYQILEHFIDENYSIKVDRNFYGSNVKLLQLVNQL